MAPHSSEPSRRCAQGPFHVEVGVVPAGGGARGQVRWPLPLMMAHFARWDGGHSAPSHIAALALAAITQLGWSRLSAVSVLGKSGTSIGPQAPAWSAPG